MHSLAAGGMSLFVFVCVVHSMLAHSATAGVRMYMPLHCCMRSLVFDYELQWIGPRLPYCCDLMWVIKSSLVFVPCFCHAPDKVDDLRFVRACGSLALRLFAGFGDALPSYLLAIVRGYSHKDLRAHFEPNSEDLVSRSSTRYSKFRVHHISSQTRNDTIALSQQF